MRGWLPILALGACLAAGTLPATAGDTQSGVWVYEPGIGYVWHWQSYTIDDEDTTRDGNSAPLSTEVTEAGVTVVRGGHFDPPTVEQSADGVTVTRSRRTHQ